MYGRRPARGELVSVIQGQCDLLIFTSDGVVKDRIALGFGGTGVAEIPGGSWHSVVFRAPGAVVLEIKSGPYEPQIDKEFANWAPKEADPLAAQFVRWLEVAAAGERVSSTFPSQ